MCLKIYCDRKRVKQGPNDSARTGGRLLRPALTWLNPAAASRTRAEHWTSRSVVRLHRSASARRCKRCASTFPRSLLCWLPLHGGPDWSFCCCSRARAYHLSGYQAITVCSHRSPINQCVRVRRKTLPLFSWVNLDFGATVARSFLFDK